MITKVTAFKSSDGTTFGTLEEVQIHELSKLFSASPGEKSIAEVIIEHKDLVLDILTTGPRSKPKARTINGGTKKRTPKPAAIQPPPPNT